MSTNGKTTRSDRWIEHTKARGFRSNLLAVLLVAVDYVRCTVLGCKGDGCPATCARYTGYQFLGWPRPCGLTCKRCGKECRP